MNKQLYTLLLVVLAMWCSLQMVNAQGRSVLEKQRKALEESIKFNQEELAKVDQNKKKSLSQLDLLITQINTRQKIINNISKAIDHLQDGIDENDAVVKSLEGDLTELKARYAEMVYYAYRNRSTLNDLVFIFSAKSFNDAYKRMRYLQQYTEFRRRQAELIELTKATLNDKIADLEEQKKEQQVLLAQQISQRRELTSERTQKDELVDDLKKRQRKLLKDIKAQQNDAVALNKKIEDLIKKEIEAKKKAAALANSNNNTVNFKLSSKFAENKGKLPMPVDKGTITGKFGTHSHPVYGDKVRVTNNGIDIRTTENARVRSIFDGEVVSVNFIPGYQRVVLVMHGDYYTAYSKLNSVDVKPGDKVIAGQVIGTVFTDAEKATSEVHFELWQGINKLDPALWLYAQ